MSKRNPESVPTAIKPYYSVITELTDDVCTNHLNEEYAELARRLTAALARKRPSLIVKGRPEIWACAIVYALGTVNYLFDKSQSPYLPVHELCGLFGVSYRTGESKARTVREIMDMYPLDPEWCLPSRLADNPMVWMLEYDGCIIDIRQAPRELQVLAYEAGLIPFIPADK